MRSPRAEQQQQAARHGSRSPKLYLCSTGVSRRVICPCLGGPPAPAAHGSRRAPAVRRAIHRYALADPRACPRRRNETCVLEEELVERYMCHSPRTRRGRSSRWQNRLPHYENVSLSFMARATLQACRVHFAKTRRAQCRWQHRARARRRRHGNPSMHIALALILESKLEIELGSLRDGAPRTLHPLWRRGHVTAASSSRVCNQHSRRLNCDMIIDYVGPCFLLLSQLKASCSYSPAHASSGGRTAKTRP